MTFRGRTTGQSSIGFLDALYYMVKVGLALVVDRVREVNPRFAKGRLEGTVA